ncbi:hypothetical protein ACWDE9_13730 [Streptomyces olivaceoviridis]
MHHPRGVAEREPDPVPQPPAAPPGPWKRIKAVDWIKWATVAAALVAAFGLIATAISTYYGAMVAKDQLEQSRDDAEREVEDQASRISVWGEARGVVVANRSLYPVVVHSLYVMNDWAGPDGPAYAYLDLFAGTVPPCSSLTFAPSGVRWKGGKRLPSSSSFDPQWVIFTDHAGVSWGTSAFGHFINLDDADEKLPNEYTGNYDGIYPSKNLKRNLQDTTLESVNRGGLKNCGQMQ